MLMRKPVLGLLVCATTMPVLLVSTISVATTHPTKSSGNNEMRETLHHFPEELLVAGGNWNWLRGALKVLFGAIAAVAIDRGADAATANTCSNSGNEFRIATENTWYGSFNGYEIGLSSEGYFAVSYPDGTVKTTSNIYSSSDRNKWYDLTGTPYYYCINGSDSAVRVSF